LIAAKIPKTISAIFMTIATLGQPNARLNFIRLFWQQVTDCHRAYANLTREPQTHVEPVKAPGPAAGGREAREHRAQAHTPQQAQAPVVETLPGTRKAVMDVDKINRLPKWAQDEIRRLKANAAATQRDMEVLCGQTLQGDSASKGFLGLCPAVADGPSYHAVHPVPAWTD
jgi:hypothetical protein